MLDPPRRPTLDDRTALRRRPPRSPLMYHGWRDLLFLHWRVEPERIQQRLPPGLFVDVRDGATYLGIVAFFMRNIRPRGMPALPWFSNFMELNVRTYVHDAQGVPGIWFHSLDCNQPLTVWGARRFFHLPYRHARMSSMRSADGRIDYRSRVGTRRVETTYGLGDIRGPAVPGTLDYFLVERYVLFSRSPAGNLFSGRVFHEPYPLADVRHTAWSSTLLGEYDLAIDESRPEIVHASPGVDVEVFNLERCAPRSSR